MCPRNEWLVLNYHIYRAGCSEIVAEMFDAGLLWHHYFTLSLFGNSLGRPCSEHLRFFTLFYAFFMPWIPFVLGPLSCDNPPWVTITPVCHFWSSVLFTLWIVIISPLLIFRHPLLEFDSCYQVSLAIMLRTRGVFRPILIGFHIHCCLSLSQSHLIHDMLYLVLVFKGPLIPWF